MGSFWLVFQIVILFVSSIPFVEMNQINQTVNSNNVTTSHRTEFFCDECIGEIKCGETIQGALHSELIYIEYYFNLTINAFVVFDACGSDLKTSIYLYAHDGDYSNLVSWSDYSNCDIASQLFCPQLKPNEYRLRILSHGDDDNDTINWIVHLVCNTQSVNRIGCNETDSGELKSPSDIDYYYFHVPLNISTVIFDMCSSDYNIYLIVFQFFDVNPMVMDDNIMDTNGDCSFMVQLTLNDWEPVGYLLGISGQGAVGNHSYGNWTLNVLCDTKYDVFCSDCNFEEVQCDQTKIRELHTKTRSEYFYFNLTTYVSPLIINSCGSYSSNHINVYDIHYKLLAHSNSGHCGYASQLFIHDLQPNEYIIEMHSYGFKSDYGYGDRKLEISCNKSLQYALLDTTGNNWFDAEMSCEQVYGTCLATIITQDDMAEVMRLVANYWKQLDGADIWVPVGLFNNVVDSWKWINGKYCLRCIDDIHWSNNETDTLHTQSFAYLTNGSFHGGPLIGKYYEAIVCNAPNANIIQNCSDIVNCWKRIRHCNDSALLDGIDDTDPSGRVMAYWNSTLFIVARYEIYYTQMKSFNGIFSWNHISYNDTTSSDNIEYKLYTQHKSHLYVYQPKEYDTLGKLVYIELNNLIVNYYDISPNLYGYIDDADFACLLATDDYLYLFGAPTLFRFTINTESWKIFENVNYQKTEVCAITNDKRLIYMFPVATNDYIMKYDVVLEKSIHVNATNICYDTFFNYDMLKFFDYYDMVDFKPPRVVTAANNKFYLHGCGLASWRTLIFDPKIDKFEADTIDIDKPSNTSYYRMSQIVTYDDNILLLTTTEMVFYYAITEIISINFSSTISNIWPSDGFDIKYYLYDFSNITNNIYPIRVYSTRNDLTKAINEQIILNTSNDHCTCIKMEYNCFDCYQHFDLDNYLYLTDNWIDQLEFSITPVSNYHTKPLIIPSNITISLEHCTISFESVNDTITTYDPCISIDFVLSTNCYSKTKGYYTIAINSELLHIEKQLIINIENNHTMQCKLCDMIFVDFCLLCNGSKFVIDFDPQTLDDDISFKIDTLSNTIDLRVISSSLTMQYLNKKDGVTKYIKYYLYLFILSSLILLILVTIYVYFRYHYIHNVFIVKNALVLLIGISKFDGQQNLPNIRKCVDDLLELWRHKYNYDVSVCKDDTEELYATKMDVEDFVDEQIPTLNDEHDCIIVHILSHGSNKTFQCSDGRSIDLGFFIHEIETQAEYVNNLGLLKIMFHHGCQGTANYSESISVSDPHNDDGDEKYDKENMSRSLLNMYQSQGNAKCTVDNISFASNFKIIAGNVPDRTMSDSGNFTKCIYKSFTDNLKRFMKWSFEGLLKEIRRDLEIESKHAELVTVAFDNVCYNAIRFEKCDRNRNHLPQSDDINQIKDTKRVELEKMEKRKMVENKYRLMEVEECSQ